VTLLTQNHYPSDDECCAEDGLPVHLLSEKQSGKQENENHAELVNGSNLRGFPELESAKVAQPRGPGGKPGKDKKQHGPSIKL